MVHFIFGFSNKNITLKKNKLTQEKIDLLESIKFVWDQKNTWFENYQKLKEYYEKEGNTLVPQRSGALGLWVRQQKYNFKKNKLTQEKIDLLNQINFQWRIRN